MKYKLVILSILLILSFVLVNEEAVSNLLRKRLDSDLYFKEGVYHFNQQEYTAALTMFNRALSIEPEHLVARYWLGKAYYHSGYVRNALLEWKHLLELKGYDFFLKNKINRFLFYSLKPEKKSFNRYIKSSFIGEQFNLYYPTSVYIDKDKRYFITGYASKNVLVLDRYGLLLHEISFENTSGNPYDTILNSKGDIYISDFTNNQIHKFDSNYNFIKKIGSKGLNKGEFYGPKGLFIDKYDCLYVVDKGNNRVQKFDKKDKLILIFGEKGKENHQLLNPTDVLVIKNNIYVSDTSNKRIQVFDLNGNWLKSLGENEFKEPRGLKALSDKELLVADAVLGIVKLSISPYEFRILKSLDESLKNPIDIDLNSNHFLYVADLLQLKIPIYMPEPMKFNNLDVQIIQTYSPDYKNKNFIRNTLDWFIGKYNKNPLMTHRVRVRDQLGNPVIGLTKNHFKLYENNTKHDFKIMPVGKLKNKLKLVILNENSNIMKKHKVRLKEISHQLFQSLDVDDEVEVVNFDKNYLINESFSTKRLTSLNALFQKNDAQNISNEIKISNAFYDSISRVYNDIESIGALIIFLSGEVNEKSFDSPRYEICLNFAKNNQIPIYIIAFEQSSFKEELLELANETGGKYYSAYSSNNLKNLIKDLRGIESGQYYVQYESIFKIGDIPQWRSFKIELKINNSFGQDKSGYYTYKIR